ncbi:hypothetical protein AA0119_g10561 [Alternaria tenuissima]|nr:hypothetical protein AA0119_g10561 [Alternaria tenuissima]RYO07717.1 hypothetical protein AA0121_g11641 [Alternaria tenuissima]
MDARNAVYDFCIRGTELQQWPTAHPNGQYMLGRELYDNLDEYVKLHLQQVARRIAREEDENLVQRYDEEWKLFRTAAHVIQRTFDYISRHFINYRQHDQPPRDYESYNMYPVHSLLILRWEKMLSADLKDRLVKLLLGLIKAQRDHTKIIQVSGQGSASRENERSKRMDFSTSDSRSSLIKSIIESFAFIDRHTPDSPNNFYKEFFGNKFLAVTREYYISEQASMSGDGSKLDMSGYAHWVLNQLSVEKSFIPNGSHNQDDVTQSDKKSTTDEIVLRPLLLELHDTFYTSELGDYYHNLNVQKQAIGAEDKLLVMAGLKPHDDMVELLVGSREGLRRSDRHGQTALHYAVLAGNISLIKALLILDAPTLAQDEDGQTAGHLAVMTSNLTALNYFFARPACFTVLNGQGNMISTLIKSRIYKAPDDDWTKALSVAVQLEKAAWLFDKPLELAETNHDFQPTIVNFESGIFASQRPVSLCEILNNDAYYQKEMESGQQKRWLHFPANNMRWVELLMLRYASHQTTLSRDDILGEPIWRERLHTGIRDFAHARYMKPLCEQIHTSEDMSETSYVLMMPYIHWEFAETFNSMTNYAKQLATSSRRDCGPDSPKPYQTLMKLNMSPQNRTPQEHSPDTRDGNGRRFTDQLHIRRSLDQYHYHALSDTGNRDNDQLVSRMFDKDRDDQLKGPRVLMVVDQLWLWVLKDNTIFTSFTRRWSKGDFNDYANDTTDVFENITLDRSLMKTSHDLAGKIIYKCLTSCLDSGTNTLPNLKFLEFYSTEVDRLADEEANRLKRFRCAVEVSSAKLPRVRNDAYEDPEIQSQVVTPEKSQADIQPAEGDELDLAGDILLLEQIKDIKDELHIMKILIQDQTSVIDQFCELVSTVDYAKKAKRTVRDYRVEVDSIITRVNHTYKMLSDLLDLKQKYANVQEARSSREQAEATAQQGKTIMVFTIVTIVFLPLSFMATFFAMQVKEFENLSLNFVSKIMCKYPRH